MRTILSARFAGTAGVVSLAVFAAALITLPSFPTTGAVLSAATAPVSVNRALKGDRLPIGKPEQAESPLRSPPRAQIPLGCDAVFSPISSPKLAHVFRRCMV